MEGDNVFYVPIDMSVSMQFSNQRLHLKQQYYKQGKRPASVPNIRPPNCILTGGAGRDNGISDGATCTCIAVSL